MSATSTNIRSQDDLQHRLELSGVLGDIFCIHVRTILRMRFRQIEQTSFDCRHIEQDLTSQ